MRSSATAQRPYPDRVAAGRALGDACRVAGIASATVLGLPRGGVPVAAEVADALAAPLDVLPVRKIGMPGNPELGIGAVAEGGAVHRDHALIAELGLTPGAVAVAERQAHAELAAAVGRYYPGARPRSLTGRTAVIVDDGIATGGTMHAAVRAAREAGAARVVVAAPVGAPEAVERLRAVADAVVCPRQPGDLRAIGWWYDDFPQVPDARVLALLAASRDAAPIAESALIATGDGHWLPADVAVPAHATGLVVFAHGSGSSRRSPRNRAVAERLRDAGLGTVLLDLLTPDEADDRSRVFDIPLLARRLGDADAWCAGEERLRVLPLGLFGASTGAAAALVVAAADPAHVAAVVSRGGRPDLAEDALPAVRAPVLLIVGGADTEVLALNRAAQARLACPSELVVVPGATHLFEEPGALEAVAGHAAAWLTAHLR
ncbi:MAG: phosphoribosyltransferase family protein [Gaiellales bacterium]